MAKRPPLTHTHLFGRLKLAARCYTVSDQETGDIRKKSLMKNTLFLSINVLANILQHIALTKIYMTIVKDS